MGFPEGRKLARDVNKVTTECADKLSALMMQMSGKMDTANRILEGIASEETRTVYKPSVAAENEVLPSQGANLYVPIGGETREKTIICSNVFEAQHNGTVTFYASYSNCYGWNIYASYAVTRISLVNNAEIPILSGTLNVKESNGYHYQDFSVVEGGIYQISFYLKAGSSLNQSGSINVSASIRAIEETIAGTKTQYYYPAEGAPKIVELNKEYTYPEVPSFNGGSRDIYLFTPEVSGAVDINIDILGYTQGDKYNQGTFTIKDSTGMNTLGAITSANEKHVRYRFTVLAGEPYNLTVGYGGGDVISIGNISISAVKTSALPVSVPFVPVNEPYQLVQFTSDNQIKQGYVVKKLPESIYKTQPHFLIAMHGDVYPGNKTGSAEMVFYDVLNSKQDYRLDYDINDTDHVSRGSYAALCDGAYYSRYFVYIATIDGEICVVVQLTNPDSQPIQEVAKQVSYISATLY
jgi:hypothetical protein